MTDPRLHDTLGRYWDDLVGGRPAAPDDLDPELASLIRQLHAERDDAPAPDPGFARKLREDLMNESAFAIPIQVGGPTLDPHRHLETSRVSRSEPRPLPLAQRKADARWSRLIAAALLLVTLSAGYLAFRPFGRGPGQYSSLPAAVASPIATPAALDPRTMIGTLVETTLPGGLSTPAQYADIERLTFTTDGGSAVNPMNKSNFVLLVLSGEVTTTISTPTQLYPQFGATSAEPIAAKEPRLLHAGEALVVGAGSHLRIDHQGSVPAVVLSANVLDTDIGNPGLKGVTIQQLDSANTLFAAGPVHLLLRRMVLAPQETIPAAAAGSVQLIASEKTLPPGELQVNPGGSVTNVDTVAHPVLVLTLSQAGQGGPATPLAATPAP